MTQQHTPDFNAELERQRKATENAQTLALHWQGVADAQRAQIDKLCAANINKYSEQERRRVDYLRVVAEMQAVIRPLADLEDERNAALARVKELETAARAVIESAARELNYSPDVLLVSTAALRQLARCVQAATEPAQQGETR